MVVHFSGYVLDLSAGELTRDGLPVRLQPQPLKVLCLLASRPGQLVARDELRQEVWQSQTYVDFEQGLNTCIRQIRAALNDNTDSPRFVETVPRRGYRFIGTISADSEMPSPVLSASPDTLPLASGRTNWRPWLTLAVAGVVLAGSLYAGVRYWRTLHPGKPGKVMMAVLPFEDLSPEVRERTFSDGLTDEMIAQIGSLEPDQLGVIARTSALQYRGTTKSVEKISDELGVDYILEGTVRREGRHVRIVAKLIQVNDQTPLWVDTFESDNQSLIALQDQVAQRVARTLALKLLPTGGDLLARITTSVPEAFDDYVRARQLAKRGDPRSLMDSIPLFEAAVQHDPNYAIAYAELAETYLALSDRRSIPPQRAFPRAKQAVQEVLELDPSYADGYVLLAAIRAFYDWEWDAAGIDFMRAMERNANSPRAHLVYARYLRALGRWDQALAQLQVAEKLDPHSPVVALSSAALYYYRRDPDRTIEIARKLIAADPNSAAACRLLGLAYLQKGELEDALDMLQKAVPLSNNNSMYLGALGNAYGLAGMKTEARKIMKQMTEAKSGYVSSYDIALIHLGLGDTEATLSSLQKAVEERAVNLRYLNIDPRFDTLRDDARFRAIVQRVGLNQ